MAVVHQLIDYLKELEQRGETHVFLDEGARAVMRKVQGVPRKFPSSAPVSVVQSSEAGVEDAASELAILRASLGQAKAKSKQEPETSPAAADAPELTHHVSPAVIQGKSVREQLNGLAMEAKRRHLPSLGKRLVFADGNPEAELMLVGEAATYHDERARSPFGGAAGEKLDQILKAMSLSREAVYLTNIVKFRPLMPGQGTRNREPDAGELAAFLPVLKAEVKIVRPKVIVVFGEVAARALAATSGDLAELRGQFHEFAGVPVRASFHPRYLLHQGSALGEKRMLWEDMLAVMEHLGMQISDKQRGFFLETR